MGRRIVPYRRVSTVKQGESGLGLEAQDEAIAAYCRMNDCKTVATYTEVETAKKDEMENRPELVKGIAHAKRAKAVLVIAKLDRLSRSVYVTAQLPQDRRRVRRVRQSPRQPNDHSNSRRDG